MISIAKIAETTNLITNDSIIIQKNEMVYS